MLNDRFVEKDGVSRRERSYRAGLSDDRKWVIVDATGQVLGRLASQVAAILRGKNKPTFTPDVDCGDHVIVVNAEKIVITGRKLEQKVYYRHTGYLGGLRTRTLQEMMDRDPAVVVERAVHGMLPHNRLGSVLRKRLRVYVGPDHPHEAQQPEVISLPN